MLIQQYLKEHNLTQRRFADTIGCTTAFLNALLNGKNTDIKISLLRKISDETEINETELVTELLSFKQPKKAKRRGTKRAKKV